MSELSPGPHGGEQPPMHQQEQETPPEQILPRLDTGEEEPIPEIIYLEPQPHERAILRDAYSALMAKVRSSRTGDKVLNLKEFAEYRLLNEMFGRGSVVVKPAQITVHRRFRKVADQTEIEDTFTAACLFVMHPDGKSGQQALDEINAAARAAAEAAAAEQIHNTPPEQPTNPA